MPGISGPGQANRREQDGRLARLTWQSTRQNDWEIGQVKTVEQGNSPVVGPAAAGHCHLPSAGTTGPLS
jgi:hypothetical protein